MSLNQPHSSEWGFPFWVSSIFKEALFFLCACMRACVCMWERDRAWFFQFYKLSINKQSFCPKGLIFHLRKRIALPCTPAIILVQFITYWALATQVAQSVLTGHYALKVELLTSCLLEILKSFPNFTIFCSSGYILFSTVLAVAS